MKLVSVIPDLSPGIIKSEIRTQIGTQIKNLMDLNVCFNYRLIMLLLQVFPA